MTTKGQHEAPLPAASVILVAGARHAQIAAVLGEAGYDVQTTDLSAVASDLAANNASVCIVDLQDDWSKFEHLVRGVAQRRIALLVLAADDERALDAAVEGGATHYLPLPFADANLVRAVRLAEAYTKSMHGERGRRSGAKTRVSVETEPAVRGRIEARLKASAQPLGLMLIAFTRLEIINMAFGREIGDVLLDAVAGRIMPLLHDIGGDCAVLTRMEGAAFAVTLEGLDAAACKILAERIMGRIERPYFADHHMVSVGCRIGIVESAPGDDATSLLRRAAAALAEAQSSESGPVRALSRADEGAAMMDASLAADLRRALDADEIEILFQPQLDVTTRVIVGVEALARWRHPIHGELGAEILFAVAERSDYLTALSAHVQLRAAMIAAKWPAVLAHLRVAINLTAADIARPGFVGNFLEMIDATRLHRSRLTVEITESGLIQDLSGAAQVLADLRAGGCRVAIDDFGTGYSSLAYLKALPLDYLKIDKQLAGDIVGSPRDRIVVRGVIDMARSLGLSVVAEGVESEAQLALLAAEGCNYCQGFLFAGAIDTAALVELVNEAGYNVAIAS